MHKHLQKVREFHDQFGIEQPEYPETAHLSDMDIVMRQALLMDCGSETFKAITAGDLAKILAGLVDLAYNALAAIACRGDDVVATSVAWRQDGSVLSVMRVLADKINNCSSGESIHYSALYNICEQLARSFINADFDKAFGMVHGNLMNTAQRAGSAHDYSQRLAQETLPQAPDLSDALYE
ncbi:nucleoside triphosphate pyrophosphohydrolase family protein [Methylomonas sp. SURF-2]|uniref:Nucleoside triphosphate pyrophosphohydrolase family protein n=1 Tax=Methylomonas subterranea TaxID=2952225 RepID=A0ABT1TLI5_9GAMM|nr:nucleoside triphosphate pyrophosphohydrolase family protein [Methylomonas sp. SURF-2]MCQ8106310.1 nucleoside triphosphate pyrophosphohydrolase family protein [Methylomonas sp. SURF-2]